MKAIKKFASAVGLLAIVFIMSSCHKNIPCPAYADNANVEEISTES